LKRIAAMKSKRELGALLADLHLDTGDAGLFFGFGSNQDFENSSQVIAFATGGGLSLPDRDYYVKDDAKSKEIREKYLAHVTRVFQLMGEAADAAARKAAVVMEIETALARASLTRVDKRDPYKLFHKMDGLGLRALAPGFDWDAYLQRVGVGKLDTFNVTEPEFFKEVEKQIAGRSLDDIKTYLSWHVAKEASPYLSSPFVDASFEFFSKTLRGVPQLRPRWKRCVTLVDAQLGEALGQEFVSRAFAPKLKEDTLRMTKRIEQAMRDDITGLTWMGPETKKRAIEKLETIVNKIGYPDKWRDYSSLRLDRGSYVVNRMRAAAFENRRDLNKIGKPVDRSEWLMTPPSVNAYYNKANNEIGFPAGILQPPYFLQPIGRRH
jgi:endothelin-converting enzyme/putative endopeptidase